MAGSVGHGRTRSRGLPNYGLTMLNAEALLLTHDQTPKVAGSPDETDPAFGGAATASGS